MQYRNSSVEIRGSYQRGQRQFISLSNKDRTRHLQTKDVRGKNPSALRRHESMSPAKNCTGLTTLAKDSLSETTHLSAVGGLADEIILLSVQQDVLG